MLCHYTIKYIKVKALYFLDINSVSTNEGCISKLLGCSERPPHLGK